MEIKPNPFSFYDFLGYFTPGALVLYGGILVHAHIEGPLTVQKTVEGLSFGKAELYVPFVLSAYLLGHFLSFLSSVTIERYAIWSHGYPSRFLLKLSVPSYWKVEEKAELVVRFLAGMVLFPLPVLGFTAGRVLYLRNLLARALDEELSTLLHEKVKDLLIQKGQINNPERYSLEKDHDFFRYVYHYAVEHATNHLAKMQNYVALYGFLRTVCLIFVVGSWFVLWHLGDHVLRILNGEGVEIVSLGWLLGGFMVASYVAYMGFMKFYRRFSLEALMAMAVVFQRESNPALKSDLGVAARPSAL